jgi:cell surface protein SprA
MSINFIGVRKQRGPEQKQQVYDPENFTFLSLTIKWSDMILRLKIIDQQVSSSVDYAFSFQPKPIEPFKNTGFMKKQLNCSVILILIIYLLMSFNTNINRQYNRQQFRQVDVGIGLDPLYRRNFAFNYQYGFNYNLTKSLKVGYTASSGNIVKLFE